MAPRPRWWKHLQEAKKEALLAVDLFNRVDDLRRLEAFIVHMQIAWTYLLQARFERDGVDYWHRDRTGRRVRGKDGEFRTWSLGDCLAEEFPDPHHPVRRNVEFFIGLRNRIEHRASPATVPTVTGRCQSMIMNFEETLVIRFGDDEGLADRLRFPVFLSSLTSGAVESLKETYKRIPRAVASYVENFDAALDEDVLDDARYEFRVLLVQKTGPRSTADVAMEFVRLDELNDEQRQGVEKMQTLVRDKQVPVAHFDHVKASDVSKRVELALGVPFSVYGEHVTAWRHYKVRPESGSDAPEQTNARYCVYDPAHNDYLYTQAWIDKLIMDLGDGDSFEGIIGHPPRS